MPGLDPSRCDADNNTLLHKIYWYANIAVSSGNKQQASFFNELVSDVESRLSHSLEAWRITAEKKNNHGETIADNMLTTAPKSLYVKKPNSARPLFRCVRFMI